MVTCFIFLFLNKIIKILQPVIIFLEQKLLSSYSQGSLKHQPIFIIGAPRTGSTILYQTITNNFDVLYFDNLICGLNGNLFLGFWLSNLLFRQRPHNCFKSKHGDTSQWGLHAPSECGQFWYRWLPFDRHFIDYDEISESKISEIRNEIALVINYFDKPLVINNNNMALRIRLLKKIFPEAKYIVADREPFFVAQSLLKARRKITGNYKDWWSILPRNYNELLNLSPEEQVVKQHYYINKQMYADLAKLIQPDFYITVDYSNFCKNPQLISEQISSMISFSKERENAMQHKIIESQPQDLDAQLAERVRQHIISLDWHDYSS